MTKAVHHEAGLGLDSNFAVRCLDVYEDGQVPVTARKALMNFYSYDKKRGRRARAGREAAIWRGMLLRSSKYPNDVIYSVQDLFNTTLILTEIIGPSNSSSTTSLVGWHRGDDPVDSPWDQYSSKEASTQEEDQ